jgi:hypothetical protein
MQASRVRYKPLCPVDIWFWLPRPDTQRSRIYKRSELFLRYSCALLLSSSMHRRQSCRFFNLPGGCRRSDCRFEHVRSDSSSNQQSIDSSTTMNVNEASSDATVAAPPSGTCSFFWKTGNCKRGFQCRFKHNASPEVQTQTQTPSTSSAVSTLAPFLTPAGIARLSGVGSDALFASASKPRTPVEVHNVLKRFSYDDYTFRSALDAYTFLSLLTDATTTNNTWVCVMLQPWCS